MTLPRCGRPDIETYNSANNRIGVYGGFAGFIARKKRYAAGTIKHYASTSYTLWAIKTVSRLFRHHVAL